LSGPAFARAFAVAEEGPPFFRRRGHHIRLGRRGEEAAERHLESRGYRVLERRYRTRAGEIDFIAVDGPTLVFVEVKTRSSLTFGRPAEAVGPRKRARIAAAASLYLAFRGGAERPCRFDVVEVVEDAGGTHRVRLIRDAFEAG
jgi:putative endonuclease